MRSFATVVALALAASVSAQSSTVESSTATSTSLSPEQTCLAACPSTDICCQAACVKVPCPDASQVNATTECAGQCFQGNGTEEETAAYAACQSKCVSSYFLTTTAAGAQATGASSSGSSPSENSATATGSESASGSATGASGSASATSTSNAGSNIRASIAGAGLFGLLIAGLSL